MFGLQELDSLLLQRIQAVTGQVVHPYFTRQIFQHQHHRDLNHFLDAYEKDKTSVFLYTGRGPSSESLHLGHVVQFQFVKYLQDLFDCQLIIG